MEPPLQMGLFEEGDGADGIALTTTEVEDGVPVQPFADVITE